MTADFFHWELSSLGGWMGWLLGCLAGSGLTPLPDVDVIFTNSFVHCQGRSAITFLQGMGRGLSLLVPLLKEEKGMAT